MYDWRRECAVPAARPSWAPVGDACQLPAPVDFIASQQHFARHLVPVWDALPEDERGDFYCAEPDWVRGSKPLLHRGRALAIGGRGPIVAAGYSDIAGAVRLGRPLVLFEHGAGFSFGTRHPSYAGGAYERAAVSLFVGPNDYVRARNLWAFPGCATASVGCPKLDEWHRRAPKPRAERPVVCLSFHWDCACVPETRSALPHYEAHLPKLVRDLPYTVIGHGHPRAAETWARLYDGLGIEYVPSFDEVMARADLYVNDASSTLYEFASTGRPVVCLNAPWYRRERNVGLRFWEHLPGPAVDGPSELAAAIDAALAETDPSQREAAVDAAYAVHDGTAAAHAAEAILAWREMRAAA